MKSENIVCEEWRGYKPNMPVQVVGVKNGKITGDGGGVEVFKNLKDAQKKYDDLDPEENTMRFTWVTRGEVNGKPAGRFETWKAYKMYSMEEEVLRKAVVEAKFNAKILPANLEDLEMKTLIVCIGSAVIGLLDRIKKNTGSNSNPVSLQVMKGGDAIKSVLKKNLDLKGKEALAVFFKETNQHFDSSAPVISSIVRKYKLKSDRYSGKVFVEQETGITEASKTIFNARMLPANLEDLTMETLKTALVTAAAKMMRNGDYGKAFGKEIKEDYFKIIKALKSKMNLKGMEALRAFFDVTNKNVGTVLWGNTEEFKKIIKKYNLPKANNAGQVMWRREVKETKLRELLRGYMEKLTEKAGINIPDNIVDLQDRIAQKKNDVSWWEKQLQKSRKPSLISMRAMHHKQAKDDLKTLEKALKKAQKNESTQEPIEEAKKSKMIPMEKYGAAFMVDNGTLMSVAMLRDGSFETWDGDLDWGEVTAPDSQKFLDDINKKFKTKFKMDDFAGR